MIGMRRKIIDEFYKDKENAHVKDIIKTTMTAVYEDNKYLGVAFFENKEDVEKYIIKTKLQKENKEKQYKIIKL